MTQARASKGLIMVVILLLLPVCVMLGATMLSNTFAERHFLRYERERGQSFYLAELGLNAGYYSFASSVFGAYTHSRLDLDASISEAGDPVSQAKALLVDPAILQQLPFSRVTSGPFQGWFEYRWTPGQDRRSLTGSGMEEIIRFRVTQTGLPTSEGRPGTWEVVAQAHLGPITKTHRLSGTLRGLNEFTIFDSGDLNEFIQSSDRVVRGMVHANGDLYLKPSEANLSIVTSSFTAGGNIWYGRDATGRTNMGTVRLGETSTTLSPWPTNFDSFSEDWVERAITLWDGIVRDHQLGAPVMGIPSSQTFEPGGFYDLKAQEDGLKLSLTGGNISVNGAYLGGSSFPGLLRTQEFYNHSEERIIRAIVIDVANLEASHYPNGLIYSESPLVLENASVLPQDTSIVSQSAIYTLGDFNKEIATLEDYQIRTDSSHPNFDPLHTNKVSAALMTKDRIWHLSSQFELDLSPTFSPNADNPEAFPGNNAWVNRATLHGGKMVIEINALTLTGAPLYGESFNRDSQGKVNTGPNKPNGQITRWDAYLEHFTGQKVLKRRGSLIYLNQGTMADIEDPNPPEGFVAWYRRVAYNPPSKDFDYDEMLRTNPPPFVPYVANRTLWKRF